MSVVPEPSGAAQDATASRTAPAAESAVSSRALSRSAADSAPSRPHVEGLSASIAAALASPRPPRSRRRPQAAGAQRTPCPGSSYAPLRYRSARRTGSRGPPPLHPHPHHPAPRAPPMLRARPRRRAHPPRPHSPTVPHPPRWPHDPHAPRCPRCSPPVTSSCPPLTDGRRGTSPDRAGPPSRPPPVPSRPGSPQPQHQRRAPRPGRSGSAASRSCAATPRAGPPPPAPGRSTGSRSPGRPGRAGAGPVRRSASAPWRRAGTAGRTPRSSPAPRSRHPPSGLRVPPRTSSYRAPSARPHRCWGFPRGEGQGCPGRTRPGPHRWVCSGPPAGAAGSHGGCARGSHRQAPRTRRWAPGYAAVTCGCTAASSPDRRPPRGSRPTPATRRRRRPASCPPSTRAPPWRGG